MSRMTRSPMRDAAPTHDSARPHDAGVVSTSPRARRLSRMLAILIVGAVCLGAVSIASATTVTHGSLEVQWTPIRARRF